MNLMRDREEISKKLNIGKELLYLTKPECMNIGITLDRILQLTREALIAHGKKEYEMPAKIGVHPSEEVFYHAMPAYVPSKKAVGMKWIECYPNNPNLFNLPQTTGLLILNDILSGCPIAIMDSTWLTAMRTPAVTVLAAAALHPEAESFGMFGCGVQGIEHIRFIVKTLKKLKKIYIYDVKESAMDYLIKTVQPNIEIEIIKGQNPQQLAEKCEVLSSATIIVKNTLSVVKDEWISKGQTVLPCDLNTFWDPKISRRADKYIVDSIEEHELFSKMGYFPDGLPTIACETGEILAGIKEGRTSKDELIVCSNIGMAVCDVVVGREIFDIALKNNMGTILSL
ncbi:MAG: ornithine cyclodeaminase family protein [Eubacteriales bacterium]|nr:ornithine cyclodeaminase family protein [Eubacteriales bacterium]